MKKKLSSVVIAVVASTASMPAVATDGTVDGAFGTNGAIVFDNAWLSTPWLGSAAEFEFAPENSMIDSQGRILVVGRATGGGSVRAAVLRLSQAGVVDATFGTNGLVTFSGPGGSSVAYDVVETADSYLVYTMNGPLDDRIGPPMDIQAVMRVRFDGGFDTGASTPPSWFQATPTRTSSSNTARPVGMPHLASGTKFSIVTGSSNFGEMIWTEFDSVSGAKTGGDFIFMPNLQMGQGLAAFQTGSAGAEKFHVVQTSFSALNLYTFDRANSFSSSSTALSTGLTPMTAYSNADIPLRLSDGSVVVPVVDHRDNEGQGGPQGVTNKVGLVKVTSAGALDTGFSTDGLVVVDGITASTVVGPTYVDIAEVPGNNGGIAVSGTASNGNAQLAVIASDGAVRLAATELSSATCKGATKTVVANSSGEVFGFGVNPAGKFVMVKFSSSGVAGSACGQVATPGAPVITGVTAGDGQLSVAFTAPSSNGGAAITNYEVSTDNGAAFTALSPASTASPIVITGLTNATQYSIQIKAVNSAGAGAASNTEVGTPVAAPSGGSSGSGSSGGGSSGSGSSGGGSSGGSSSAGSSSTTSTTAAPASGGSGTTTQAPSLVTSANQEQLTSSAGSAKLLINGELVEVELVQAPEALRRTAAGARTFAEVRALQTLAQDMVAAVQKVLGAGGTLPISVSNTSTGASITGLVTDPVTGLPLAVPVEDVLLIVNQNLVLMVGGADGANNPANIAFDGVLEFGQGGFVAVLAYGLTPGADGEVVVMSSPTLLDTFEVGSDGGVAIQSQIPSAIAPGDHTVVVAVDGQSASLGFRVLSPGVLPSTGDDQTPLPWAVLVLAFGAFAVLTVTRRRTMV